MWPNEAVKKHDFRTQHHGVAPGTNRMSGIWLAYPQCAAISALCAPPAGVTSPQPLMAALFGFSLPQVRLRQLLDVMHHAIQIPLRVDLGTASVVQPGHALVVPDVAKHRLHRANALAVKLSAAW